MSLLPGKGSSFEEATFCALYNNRDMDEARSILKECGEFIGQATSTVPRSIKIAQSGRVGGAASGSDGTLVPSNDKDEPMKVSDDSAPKVRQYSVAVGGSCLWWGD